MIHLDRVSLSLNGSGKVLLVDRLDVDPGERVVLLGVNGSGKSTLLKLLNGMLYSDAGSYHFNQRQINEQQLKSVSFQREFRQQNCYLFQNADSMIFNSTVFEEIAFGPRQLQITDIEARVLSWASRLEIDHLLERSPLHLSGGEKKLVSLASVLVMESELLLLDEPLNNLDPWMEGLVLETIDSLNLTIISAVHGFAQARMLGSRAVVIGRDHRMIFDGKLSELEADRELCVAAGLIYRRRDHAGNPATVGPGPLDG